MHKESTQRIQDATLRSLKAQIERCLSVARIKGWAFPEEADVGVTVVASTPIATKIKARMDEVSLEATISSTNTVKDVAKICDDLVAEWLVLHATAKPTKKRRANG
jgi:hypothetical protein